MNKMNKKQSEIVPAKFSKKLKKSLTIRQTSSNIDTVLGIKN